MRDLFVRFKSWASVVDCEARRGIVAAMRSPMSRIRNQEDEEGYISSGNWKSWMMDRSGWVLYFLFHFLLFESFLSYSGDG